MRLLANDFTAEAIQRITFLHTESNQVGLDSVEKARRHVALLEEGLAIAEAYRLEGHAQHMRWHLVFAHIRMAEYRLALKYILPLRNPAFRNDTYKYGEEFCSDEYGKPGFYYVTSAAAFLMLAPHFGLALPDVELAESELHGEIRERNTSVWDPLQSYLFNYWKTTSQSQKLMGAYREHWSTISPSMRRNFRLWLLMQQSPTVAAVHYLRDAEPEELEIDVRISVLREQRNYAEIDRLLNVYRPNSEMFIFNLDQMFRIALQVVGSNPAWVATQLQQYRHLRDKFTPLQRCWLMVLLADYRLARSCRASKHCPLEFNEPEQLMLLAAKSPKIACRARLMYERADRLYQILAPHLPGDCMPVSPRLRILQLGFCHNAGLE